MQNNETLPLFAQTAAPCDAFEAWLRERGLPFVAVDEAKHALFSGSTLETFDFLVYREGRNFLVCTGTPNDKTTGELMEWEKVFGPDFQAAYATMRPDGRPRFADTDGIELSFD